MSRKIVAAIRETRHGTMADVELALADCGEVSRGDVQRGLEALLEPPTLTGDAYKLACAFFVGLVKLCPDRALFVPMMKALPKAPHATAREALVRAIPLVNNITEHGLLVAVFRNPDEAVRTAGLRLLDKITVAATVEALAADFKGGAYYPAASTTLMQLVERIGSKALPILVAAVANNDVRMIVSAFDAIVRARELIDDKATFTLAAKTRMRDGDDEIAAAATSCFIALVDGEEAFVDAVIPVLELGGHRAVGAALRGVVRFPSLRTLGLLEARLMRGPSRVSISALQVLQDVGSNEVLPTLVTAIAHRRQRVRTEAVKVLKHLAAQGRIDMARAILFLLRSRDFNVRRMASEVLNAMSQNGAAIWPKLVSFIRDEDWWVRERLVDALVPMAGAALIPHLAPFLDDAAASMRRFAVTTLGRIGDAQALGALLLRARDDGDWLVREESVRAIGQVGDARAVPYLVKLLDAPGLEIACLDALRKLKRDEARELLPALLARPERDVRMAALRYAQTIEASEHVDVVAALLNDTDAEIARNAASTLRAWHYGGAADPALDEAGRVLAELLRKVVKNDASDMILMAGRPAFMKRQGRVERLTNRELTAENVYELLAPLLLPEHIAQLGKKSDVDFSHDDRRVGARFRVNAFQADGGLGAVFRVIKSDVVPLDSLGVPAVVKSFADIDSGLVLFGGPPGSGKSTTLAGIIHTINQNQTRHIISIEDPIEGVHASLKSLVTQREIGVHTAGYQAALRAALREDPDVILVGELRDLETISFAVTAAETGHLVFGTVHAVAADSCVERVINAFPQERQAQIRMMLSDTLKGIVCQHLLPRRGGGRVLACEVMVNNEAIANLIRKGQAHQITSQMTLMRESGSCLMDDSLFALVEQGVVDVADAFVKARDKSRFPLPVDGAGGTVPMVKGRTPATSLPRTASQVLATSSTAPSPPLPRTASQVLASSPAPARAPTPLARTASQVSAAPTLPRTESQVRAPAPAAPARALPRTSSQVIAPTPRAPSASQAALDVVIPGVLLAGDIDGDTVPVSGAEAPARDDDPEGVRPAMKRPR